MNSLLVFVVIVCALAGTPLFIVMALGSLLLFSSAGTDVSAVAIEIYRLSSSPTILSIPLFTFAGYLLAESNSPKRLIRVADMLLGRLPGGTAIVGIVVAAFFTAFTGASGVTIIALGGLMMPILMSEGLSEKYSLGQITSTGSIGLLFPPSLPIILYGIVGKVDIEKLFLAGIVPGLILLISLSIYAIYSSPKKIKVASKFSLKEFKLAVIEAFPELLLPFFVVGGIYGGFVTPTEAAVLTVFWVFIIEVFWYKDLSFTKDLPRISVESMTLVGAVLVILCCALGLTNYLIDEEIPMIILDSIKGLFSSKVAFLLGLNFFLLIVGSLMDIFSAIVVVVPLITPIALSFGVHPIHLAIIFLLNLEIGYITPPVGINLFISSFRFKKDLIDLYKASIPFLLIQLIVLFFITYFEEISLIWEKTY